MQYLTRKEFNRVNATSNYTHRKLNKIEQVIKYVKTVFAMANNNQTEKAAKADEVETVVKVLSELTSNEHLLAKVRLAAYNQKDLDSLLEQYPYVQFEGLLDGTESLSRIEQLARGKFGLDQLQRILSWVFDAHALLPHLPKGVETFIWTKCANDIDWRTLAAKTEDKKYYGYALRKEVQDAVNDVFGQHGGTGNIQRMYHLRSYDLLNIPGIWKRAQMEAIANDGLMPGVKLEFAPHKVGWTEFQTVVMTEESTNTKLHFVVSG